MTTTAPPPRRTATVVAETALLTVFAGLALTVLLTVVAGALDPLVPAPSPAGATGPHSHAGGAIAIPVKGMADPWPSSTTDVRRGRQLTDLTVTLREVHHTCVKDLDVLLSQDWDRTLLLSDVGEQSLSIGCHDVHLRTLTIDDDCPPFPTPLPVEARTLPGADLCARPTDVDGPGHEADDFFGIGYPELLGLRGRFGGHDPSGRWELNVVDDAAGGSGSIGSWSVEITTGDQPPVAGHGTVRAHKGEPVRIVLPARDTEDGNQVGCNITGGTEKGWLVLDQVTGGCSGTYTPTPRITGRDVISFVVTDSARNTSGVGTLTVDIVNRPPVADAVDVTVPTGGRVALPLGGDDPDPEEPVACTSLGPALLGRIDGSGCARSYLAGDRAGTEEIAYAVADGFGGEDTATIRVQVVASGPTATAQAVTAPKGTTTPIALTGTGPGPLTCVVDATTAQGRGTIGGTGCNRTFTPRPGASGADAFTFAVRTASGALSTRATVAITIPNRAPAAPTIALTVPQGDSAAVALGGTDPDPGEGVALACTPATGPTTLGRVSGDGCFATYTAGDAPGRDSFTYVVRDRDGASATGRVDVTVQGTAPAGCTATDVQDARYVCRTYADLLGRTASAADKAYWVGRLARGEHRSAVVKAFTGTPEYRASVVRGIWRAFLGATPDPATQQRWVEQLGRGADPDLVRQEALASAAFLERAGGTPEGFVAGLHQQLLRRPATAAELSTLAAGLRAGTTTRAAVVARLLATDADPPTVAAVYERFLRRSPPAVETDYWVGRLQRGESELALVRLVVASGEYRDRA